MSAQPHQQHPSRDGSVTISTSTCLDKKESLETETTRVSLESSLNSNSDSQRLKDGTDTQDETNTNHTHAHNTTADKIHAPNLTWTEIRNLSSMLIAYACNVSTATAIVGSSAVVVLSVGGSSQTAPFALASYLLGSAVISLVTSPLFTYGRKVGFFVGNALGIFGASLGAIAIFISSVPLVILSCMPIGASVGIGMYLRFAAVEVVPTHAKAFAITFVLSGGCLAAFVGPETVNATKDIFGDDLLYLGVYMMIAIFSTVQAIFVAIVKFPQVVRQEDEKELHELHSARTLSSLLWTRDFLVSLAFSTLSWTIMIMPMSVVRVAMGELGYTARQSLWVMEIHFLSMYFPGFVTSKIINRKGPLVTCALSTFFFVAAMPFNLLSESKQDGVRATWYLGLVGLGIGWNLGFSCGTVLLTHVYAAAPHLKPRVQATHDFFMFLITGGFTFSTGYIYDAGGGMLEGWRLVNYVVVGLIGVFVAIVLNEYLIEKKRAKMSLSMEAGATP